MNQFLRFALMGTLAGAINGLLGTGGGMLLVPMLLKFSKLDEYEVFPTSVSIIAPLCLVSLIFASVKPDLRAALPYLLGGAVGGFLAGKTEQKIPVKWLHRGLGILILFSGVRYLC